MQQATMDGMEAFKLSRSEGMRTGSQTAAQSREITDLNDDQTLAGQGVLRIATGNLDAFIRSPQLRSGAS
jgi:hypothetical protein